jgi:hypothetical protein
MRQHEADCSRESLCAPACIFSPVFYFFSLLFEFIR